jgi:hypothetical protein
VAWAVRAEGAVAVDDDLIGHSQPTPVALAGRPGDDLRRAWVTVARFSPGQKGAIGDWEDRLLAGMEVYEDPYLCSGGQLMGLAGGQDAAVLDPRPLFASAFCAHPYDLAALVVAREAGVIVEALPPGPLSVAINPDADVAWAGYANAGVARLLRARMPPNPQASSGPRPEGTG